MISTVQKKRGKEYVEVFKKICGFYGTGTIIYDG